MLRPDQNKQALLYPFSRVALAGFVLALLAAVGAISSGLGTRVGWWSFLRGFVILRWAVYGGLAAAAISLVACLLPRPKGHRRGFIFSILGLLMSLIVVGVPLHWMRTAKRVPPIHDITTDTENPPRFVAILPIRRNAPNPAEYGGPEIAAQQHSAYPDLKPLVLPTPVERAFELSLMAAQKMCWGIVGKDLSAGRIEATDTTFWFGFKDDIIIRITPSENGSRIDVRSVSRVGRSDVGTNAWRILKYLKELQVIEKEHQRH